MSHDNSQSTALREHAHAGGLATAVLEASGMLRASEKAVVETVLGRRPGVEEVEANPVSQTATVTYDPSVTSVEELSEWVTECGYHCAGQILPAHLCVAETTRVAPAREPAVDHDAMAHEMGHGAGMGAHAMARDMRNRFWVSLFFSVPVFLLSQANISAKRS